jgi:lipopolysaccharide export system permease protein
MWLPNLLFIGIGVYLFRKTAIEERIAVFDLPMRIITWGRERVSAWRKPA